MIHTIQTVSDYIEEIEKLINNKKHNYYFRGQDRKSTRLNSSHP